MDISRINDTSRFSSFLKIQSVSKLKKEPETKKDNKEEKKKFSNQQFKDSVHINKAYYKISKDIDDLLNGHMYDNVLELIKKGYKPNEEQINKISDVLYEEIFQENYQSVENWVNKGWEITEQQCIELLLNEDFQKQHTQALFSYNILEKYPEMSKQIIHFIKQPNFQKDYFKVWLERFTQEEDTPFNDKTKLLFPLKNNPSYLLAHLQTLEDFSQLSEMIGDILLKNSFLEKEDKEKINNELAEIEKIGKNLFNQDIKELEQKIIAENLSSYLQASLKDKLPVNVQVNDLPENLMNIIQKISEHYKEIVPYLNKLKENKKTEINKLINENLLTTVYNYLMTPETYKTQFYSKNGTNIQSLTLNTLLSISKVFENLVTNIHKFKNQQNKIENDSIKDKNSKVNQSI